MLPRAYAVRQELVLDIVQADPAQVVRPSAARVVPRIGVPCPVAPAGCGVLTVQQRESSIMKHME